MKTLQQEIYNTAIKRGFNTDLGSCIDHLLGEVGELKVADESTGICPNKARRTESDKVCMELYKTFFKDKVMDEIADISSICDTMAEEMGEDLVEHKLLKLRINKLR